MALTFDIGDADRPKGHAIVYFQSPATSEVIATYVLAWASSTPPLRSTRSIRTRLTRVASASSTLISNSSCSSVSPATGMPVGRK